MIPTIGFAEKQNCTLEVARAGFRYLVWSVVNSPTHTRKRLRERRDATLRLGIVFVARRKHADAPHPPALLRSRRERPVNGDQNPRKDGAKGKLGSLSSAGRAAPDERLS